MDHPFHIHQNPCWVTRVEVPDENGYLVNILDRPRGQDVVWLPRNGGRVVFRSRFPDSVGLFVNHCHPLLHEDHGMMQVIDITPFADRANYEMKESVTNGGDPGGSLGDLPAVRRGKGLAPEHAVRRSQPRVGPAVPRIRAGFAAQVKKRSPEA